VNHEQFIAAIADVAASRLASDEAEAVRAIKLVYGAGPDGVRGVTYYNKWKGANGAVPFVEISAFNQSSHCQVAGTVLHELGHVLAPIGAGHDRQWVMACSRLGLRGMRAAGTAYCWAHFAPDVREAVLALPLPREGTPNAEVFGSLRLKLKPCGAGIGVRGGKSRGAGSGSRLRLFECDCVPPVKVRVARDEFDATCNCCDHLFNLKTK
jgi:hypothetical protein